MESFASCLHVACTSGLDGRPPARLSRVPGGRAMRGNGHHQAPEISLPMRAFIARITSVALELSRCLTPTQPQGPEEGVASQRQVSAEGPTAARPARSLF